MPNYLLVMLIYVVTKPGKVLISHASMGQREAWILNFISSFTCSMILGEIYPKSPSFHICRVQGLKNNNIFQYSQPGNKPEGYCKIGVRPVQNLYSHVISMAWLQSALKN